MKTIALLFVEDNADDAFMISQAFRRAGYSLDARRVETQAAMEVVLSEAWDAILCDYILPLFAWPGALELARQRCPDTPFVVLSGQIDDDRGAAAIRAGATDYLDKRELVERAIRLKRGAREYNARAASVIRAAARTA